MLQVLCLTGIKELGTTFAKDIALILLTTIKLSQRENGSYGAYKDLPLPLVQGR